MDHEDVVMILNWLGIDPTFSVENLIDKCLVVIGEEKRLWMHQLIRDRGREIARQESPKCRRIRHHTEALTLLEDISVKILVHLYFTSFYMCLSELFFFFFSFYYTVNYFQNF